MKLKIVATAAAVAAAPLLMQTPASADARYQQFWTSDTYVDDPLPCVGEPVLVTQTQHTLFDPSSVDTITEIHGNAVGLATGATYELNSTEHARVTSMPDGWVETFHNLWIGRAGAPNWYSTETGRLVYNPNGTYTITFTSEDSCVQPPA
jgi:hypothetical protein